METVLLIQEIAKALAILGISIFIVAIAVLLVLAGIDIYYQGISNRSK